MEGKRVDALSNLGTLSTTLISAIARARDLGLGPRCPPNQCGQPTTSNP